MAALINLLFIFFKYLLLIYLTFQRPLKINTIILRKVNEIRWLVWKPLDLFSNNLSLGLSVTKLLLVVTNAPKIDIDIDIDSDFILVCCTLLFV